MATQKHSAPTLPWLIGRTRKLRNHLERLLNRFPETDIDLGKQIWIRLFDSVWRYEADMCGPYPEKQTEAIKWLKSYEDYKSDLKYYFLDVVRDPSAFANLPVIREVYIRSATEALTVLKHQETHLRGILPLASGEPEPASVANGDRTGGPLFFQETAKGSMDRPSQADPIWTITSTQKGPIPVTRLTGEIVWIDASAPDEPDDVVFTPEDELRIAEVTLSGRSELRNEIETAFGGPAWPPVGAVVEPFRRYATRVFDVNAAAYCKVASTPGSDSHEVLSGMVRALLSDVFGSEWESSPREKVTRTDWQLGIEGWKGTEVVVIAGNDPDKNCLYHELISDAIKYRYRFHAVLPAPIPGEPPGINLSNLEWWRYIGLNERHNLAMVIKPYLEDRVVHWQFVYTSSAPTDPNTGEVSRLPILAGPLENPLEGSVSSPPQRKRGRPTEIPDDCKRRALAARGGKARAQILYGTKYPTAQQVKNVSSILKHYSGKCTPNKD
jgi:hypothetical protein